ncbi:hypothetical protein FHG87_009386 [Trinorchestia longiramus]|nr:hypothetical protein FHG87_009386 [Trinorchestia longiramus]
MHTFLYPPSYSGYQILAGHGSEQHSLPSVPEEDFYSSEVEAAGLPPATTNTSPSYASSSSSPQPSSLLDCFHPPSQARLTTIDNASLSPITEHHSTLQRSSTSTSAMPSASISDFTRPSSDCFYPMSSRSGLHSPMDLCTPDIPSKSPESTNDTYNFSPCLSLVHSTPPSPATPQQNSLSHPPSISTPKVFPHGYDNNHQHHSPEQDLMLGLSTGPSTGDSGGPASSDGPVSGPLGYTVHHPSATLPVMQSHHPNQFQPQQQLQHGPEHRVMMGRSQTGSSSRLSPNPAQSPHTRQQHSLQQRHQVLKVPDHSSPIREGGGHNQHRIYVKSPPEQNMVVNPPSSSADVGGGTPLTHTRHQSSSSPSSHSSNTREGRRKGEYFAVPKCCNNYLGLRAPLIAGSCTPRLFRGGGTSVEGSSCPLFVELHRAALCDASTAITSWRGC